MAQADGSASAAKVIGHVTKLTGTATAIRNGVSIILNQGDNVNKGDVVQSGSDSTLGITFIDGSVFGLGPNARMVLNEMIYDPNGSNNSSLLSLVQGTISFVAGATAKHGDMKVDTPVATMGIRGTAVLVEIDFEVPGQGSAPPAKFQVLVEPDGTTGSYILFDKTTLTPLATVNQAGTQTIINAQGNVSFLSSRAIVGRGAKDHHRRLFAEVHRQHQSQHQAHDQFHRFDRPDLVRAEAGEWRHRHPTLLFGQAAEKRASAPGNGPGDRLDHIPGPPTVATFGAAFTERAGITHSSAIDAASNQINWVDINGGDTPSANARFDSFTYKNAQHNDVTASLTAEQLAAIQAVEIPLQVVQDAGNKNTGFATWTYTLADSALDFLAAGETLTLTYMARSTIISRRITNSPCCRSRSRSPAPTTRRPSPPPVSAIIERIGTGNTVFDVASGTVTFTDVDLTDRPVVSQHFVFAPSYISMRRAMMLPRPDRRTKGGDRSRRDSAQRGAGGGQRP